MQSLVFALFAIFGHDLSYISTDLDPNTKPKNPDHCKEPLLENRTIEKRLDRIVGFATNECLGDCRSAEVPEATMTTATTGDGWVDGWPRVYGLCACGSSSGTRIFQ
ncbi:PREDICTED: uncharacterized protein LOC108692847 [Atta colombica]|uniref:uncharacterized protein LOC108692847 n=1 Tax=Atta colombica TaxID=520822 RepID=UPI00084BDBDC|nr:PREDICTED: uncharacterized protein LOC108692847 [Atta colombica]